jgi:hypothetical protein
VINNVGEDDILDHANGGTFGSSKKEESIAKIPE